MQRLNADHKKTRDDLIARLDQERSALADAIAELNAQLGIARAAVEERVDAFNALITEANDEFLGMLRDNANNYMSERSEKWHDSEAGTQYESWAEQFSDIDEVEIELPDDMDEPDLNDPIERLIGIADSPREV